jgi:2-keto-3-deoxy-L-rhamnonate aldolase RhmA
VLDIGAAGVIVPLVKTADDVRLAVSACRYPPEGVRGFGPRRPIDYGARGGPEFCQEANRTVITIVQIEQREALENIDAILAVPGLTSIVVGPNDFAASLGYTGLPRHAEVIKAIDHVLARAKSAKVPMGIAIGDDPEVIAEWIGKGVSWLSVGADFLLLRRAVERIRKVVSG